jgi:glycine dehydrogenase subunit 1
MSDSSDFVHPYIPNTAPGVRAEMLKYLGLKSTDDLFQVIPERMRMKGDLNIPEAYPDELALKKFIMSKLEKNKYCGDYTSFLGGGIALHYVPAVVDLMINRGEFLTTFCSDAYSDYGKYEAWWEYQSLMGDLLEMDVVGIPTYCGGTVAYSSVLLPVRVLGRKECLISSNIDPERLWLMREVTRPQCSLVMVNYDKETGLMDLSDLKAKISDKTACIYFENPGYLGGIETQGREIAKIAHDAGALVSVWAKPISLGLLEAPVKYGADIVCGEVQSLGIHMQYGGGMGGFMAIPDKEEFKREYPFLLINLVETAQKGEYGFGYANWEETSWVLREHSMDYTGTSSALWTIPAGVYLALMGPKGMREVGETIIGMTAYAKKGLAGVPGVRMPLTATPFMEFVVNFDATGKNVAEINKKLLDYKIFGGKDISKEFPELGQSALYCVTEMISKEEVDQLVGALQEIAK